MNGATGKIVFKVKASVVDIIIADMFFKHDEILGNNTKDVLDSDDKEELRSAAVISKKVVKNAKERTNAMK